MAAEEGNSIRRRGKGWFRRKKKLNYEQATFSLHYRKKGRGEELLQEQEKRI